MKLLTSFLASWIYIFNLHGCVNPLPVGTCIVHNSKDLSERILGYDENGDYNTQYWYGYHWDDNFLARYGVKVPSATSKTWVNAHWHTEDCETLRKNAR
jgi:hypothetical protein